MIEIDGSLGEGGGQMLRSVLSLAALTKQEVRIFNIRARRSKPGLRPQHLKAVEATAKICGAAVEGFESDSQEIVFYPGDVRPGKYRFDIGTAGSTSLLLQTILLPLSKAADASVVTVTGGTHVPFSPCYHYLDLNYLPFLWKIGLDVHLRMEQAGFYPRGGGQVRAAVDPVDQISPLTLMERGRLLEIRGVSGVANLSHNIATRQRRQVIGRLGRRFPLNDIRILEMPAPSPGTFILLLAEFEHSQACYFALGEKGKPAETVADEACRAFEAFVATEGVIDQYLADQLLLPISLASGPSMFRTSQVTQHLLTNAAVIRAFLPVEIEIRGEIGEPGELRITP